MGAPDGRRVRGAEARLGKGPRWSLRRACERSMAKGLQDAEVSRELATLRKRMDRMLEQALRQSTHTDIVLKLGDGQCVVGAHSGMLSSASEYFEGMFESGMKEEKEGVVNVPGWATAGSVRGLLEWMYLGECLCVMVLGVCGCGAGHVFVVCC